MRTPGRLRHDGPLLRRSFVAAGKDRIPAAALAFHWFLAVVTAAVAAVGVISLLGLSPDSIARLIRDLCVLVPAQLADTISKALRGPGRTTGGWVATVLGGAAALWSSIEAMSALQVGLDIAYEVKTDVGFVARRLKALPLMACTVVFGGRPSPCSFSVIRSDPIIVTGVVPVGPVGLRRALEPLAMARGTRSRRDPPLRVLHDWAKPSPAPALAQTRSVGGGDWLDGYVSRLLLLPHQLWSRVPNLWRLCWCSGADALALSGGLVRAARC